MTIEKIINHIKPNIKQRLHYAGALAVGSGCYSYFSQQKRFERELKGKPVPWEFHILPVTGWTTFGFCLPQIALPVFFGIRGAEVLANGSHIYQLWKRDKINELVKEE